jgi:hypothetical protein
MKQSLGFFVVLLSLSSCTARDVYNSLQASQEMECDKLQTVQRQECLNRLAPNYDKYEEERKKLLKKQP